ncbi:hypothetical protein QM996_01150 [Sinorhizobium chiapasense]
MTDSKPNPFSSLIDHLDPDGLRAYCRALERVNLELQQELAETKLRAINIMTDSPSELFH